MGHPADFLFQEILPDENLVAVKLVLRLLVEVDQIVEVLPDIVVLLLVLVEVQAIFFEVGSLQPAN